MNLEVSENWALIEDAPPTWIPLLPQFTGTPWRDQAEYSSVAAGWIVRALGSQLSSQEQETMVSRLAAVVVDAYEAIYARAHQVFLHVPSLDLAPLPVFLNIWKSEGDKDTVLRGLTGAEDPAVVRPPIIEDVSTGHLGSGLRVYRVTRSAPDSPELLGTIAYAFRSEEYVTDIQLQAVSYDLGFLEACVDGLDEFAGCIVPTRSPDATEA
jgi:hypothetical protein